MPSSNSCGNIDEYLALLSNADLKGFDAQHTIRDVRFQNVVNGQPLKPGDVKQDAFFQSIRVAP